MYINRVIARDVIILHSLVFGKSITYTEFCEEYARRTDEKPHPRTIHFALRDLAMQDAKKNLATVTTGVVRMDSGKHGPGYDLMPNTENDQEWFFNNGKEHLKEYVEAGYLDYSPPAAPIPPPAALNISLDSPENDWSVAYGLSLLERCRDNAPLADLGEIFGVYTHLHELTTLTNTDKQTLIRLWHKYIFKDDIIYEASMKVNQS